MKREEFIKGKIYIHEFLLSNRPKNGQTKMAEKWPNINYCSKTANIEWPNWPEKRHYYWKLAIKDNSFFV